MTVSEQVARFVVGVRYEDLPAEVVRDVRLRLLDALGLALASTREPYAKQVLELTREWYGTGQCTAVGLAGGLSAAAAGFVNATLVHGQDYDDTHTETLVHATSCIAPAAFALAQEHGLSGRELVTLAAIGYEIDVRAGLVAAPNPKMHARGFHTTAVCGAIAASAMAGRALGRGEAVARNAVALSTSVASGLLESPRDGSFAKGIQPGWAVQGGLWAAKAAAAGITGPREAFEGVFGFYAAHMGLEQARMEQLTEGLGERWEFLNTDYKLYPLCHFLQAHVESALSIRQELGIRGPDEIAWVRAELCREVVPMVCEPRQVRTEPSGTYGIKFSVNYASAMALAYGFLETEAFQRALADPAVRSLAERTSYVPLVTEHYPIRLPGSLEVGLRDGRSARRTFTSSPGRFGRPIADEEIEAKFRSNAVPVIGNSAAEKIISQMKVLPELPSIDFLGEIVPTER